MIAILPAAGQAVRFSGILKECLPINKNDCALTNSIRFARKLYNPDTILILSNERKIKEHVHAVKSANISTSDVHFVLSENENVWHAIVEHLRYSTPAALVLPDTVTDTDSTIDQSDINIGYFYTQEPHRFSTLFSGFIDNKLRHCIYTKPKGGNNAQPCSAWGTIQWSLHITNYFLSNSFDHYDTAFNAALSIEDTSVNLFKLDYYYDLGDFDSYKRYLKK